MILEPRFEHDIKVAKCNEEAINEKEHKIRKDAAKKHDKSKIRDSSYNPHVCGRIHGKGWEVSDTSQFNEKIIGVEAGLSSLYRRLVFIEKNFSSLEIVAFEGLDELKSKIIDLEEVNKERLTNP